MTDISPNDNEMGEFLHEITKNRFKNYIHISTFSDGEKKRGVQCVLLQKITDKFSENTLIKLNDEAFARGNGLFLSTL